MITGTNELKTLANHISSQCKWKFDGRKCNSNQKWNNDKYWCECKKHQTCKKYYIWNPATCTCKSRKYLVNIIDDSVIMCDEVMNAEETKTVTTNFNDKNAICEIQTFYILLVFSLTTTALLRAVSI